MLDSEILGQHHLQATLKLSPTVQIFHQMSSLELRVKVLQDLGLKRRPLVLSDLHVIYLLALQGVLFLVVLDACIRAPRQMNGRVRFIRL